MELKNVVKKIMGSDNLKSQLKDMSSFNEIHDFFKVNGYDGTETELKKQLFKIPTSIKTLPDNYLENVSGGISGKQVLAACASFMLFTGTIPSMLGISNYTDAKTPQSYNTIIMKSKSLIGKPHRKTSNFAEVQHDKLLRFTDPCTNYWMAVYARLSATEYGREKNSSSDLDYLATKMWFIGDIERFKYYADLSNLDFGTDVTEYKARADKLLTETDFKNFDQKDFESKLENLYGDARKELGDDKFWGNEETYLKMLKSNLTKTERSEILKSLVKKMEEFDKKFGTLWSDKTKLRENHIALCLMFAGEVFNMNLDNRYDGEKVLKMIGMNENEIKEFESNYLLES